MNSPEHKQNPNQSSSERLPEGMCDVWLANQRFQSRESGQRLSINDLEIVDYSARDISLLDQRKDYDVLNGLYQSWRSCVVPIEAVRSNDKSLGFMFERDYNSLMDFLLQPGAQLLVVKEKNSDHVFGGHLYLTSGVCAVEDIDIAAEVMAKAGIRKGEKVAWVIDAWIAPEARARGLYPALTGHMMKEIFEKHKMDRALAYVRLNPCANPAMRIHNQVGWQALGEEVTISYPSPDILSTSRPNNPALVERDERVSAIIKAGGLKLGILEYPRTTFSEKREQLLAYEHTYLNFDHEEQ